MGSHVLVSSPVASVCEEFSLCIITMQYIDLFCCSVCVFVCIILCVCVCERWSSTSQPTEGGCYTVRWGAKRFILTVQTRGTQQPRIIHTKSSCKQTQKVPKKGCRDTDGCADSSGTGSLSNLVAFCGYIQNWNTRNRLLHFKNEVRGAADLKPAAVASQHSITYSNYVFHFRYVLSHAFRW